jgi:hypothetical protein
LYGFDIAIGSDKDIEEFINKKKGLKFILIVGVNPTDNSICNIFQEREKERLAS